MKDDRKYTKTHEWVKDNNDGTFTVGITDHAQDLLGDVVFVELPETGFMVDAGVEVAVVESVKAASDIYSPVAGEIKKINKELADTPELINQSAFDKGWIFVIKSDADISSLLDAGDYQASIEAD